MYNRRYRGCCCNNNSNCNNNLNNSNIIEDSCNCVDSSNSCYADDVCDCGFDEENNVFPSNPMLAQSYVPIQYMNKTFIPEAGLRMGTIFPELVSPYYPGQSMEEDEYIRATNTIGEGCNKC